MVTPGSFMKVNGMVGGEPDVKGRQGRAATLDIGLATDREGGHERPGGDHARRDPPLEPHRLRHRAQGRRNRDPARPASARSAEVPRRSGCPRGVSAVKRSESSCAHEPRAGRQLRQQTQHVVSPAILDDRRRHPRPTRFRCRHAATPQPSICALECHYAKGDTLRRTEFGSMRCHYRRKSVARSSSKPGSRVDRSTPVSSSASLRPRPCQRSIRPLGSTIQSSRTPAAA